MEELYVIPLAPQSDDSFGIDSPRWKPIDAAGQDRDAGTVRNCELAVFECG
jgi:hypothetical protein